MMKFRRTLQVLICASLFSASIGCAANQKHESTGEYLDDSVITTKVKAAIFKEESLKTLQINVKTYKGQAQLSGFVDSKESAVKAGEIAERVKGVESVKNDLTVK
ncbi:MAG TPA: transporter [Geobacter sp.]|nr:transporter [Geobacter sp.]